MPLYYYLTPNRINPGNDNYTAVSTNGPPCTIDDVYDYMTRHSSTLTKAEALAAFEEITQGILYLTGQGHAVVTPLVNIKPTLRGLFNGKDDRFDRRRHRVQMNVTPGVRLRDAAKRVAPKKVQKKERAPQPASYYDNATGQRNRQVTPGGGAHITGTLLKFDASDGGQGIFFISKENGTETRVASSLLHNMPAELIFVNPDLGPGTYTLQPHRATEVRRGTLRHTLTVQNRG